MEEDDERAVELSAIAAIFPELVIDEKDPYHATLDILVTPEKPLKIYFQSSTQAAPQGILTPPTTDRSGGDDAAKAATVGINAAVLNVDVHQLAHLPPLKLDIQLPEGYPQEKPPVVRVHADQLWLPEKTLGGIKDRCAEFWDEAGHDQVVYTFIDYIQQEAEKAFGLADNKEDKFELPSNLKLILLDYDHKRRQEQFENETFNCGICLEPKKGRICHQMLLCGHVFCVPCLQDFYDNAISEGNIDSVKCLDPGCGKATTSQLSPARRRKVDLTLNPNELLQIPIEQEQVQRYVRLKRKQRLEADKNTIYCPRQWCQGAAKSKRHPKSDDPLYDAEVSEPESEVEKEVKVQSTKKKKSKDQEIPMSERLSVCEDCNFAFCSVCKKGWHGELANCNPRRQEELNEEEQASLDYLKRFSTPCPTCEAPAQKTHGCNHMICFKCKTHFCYLCSSFLMPENPYRHFNDLKSTCYMRLWELEGGDGADVGIGYGGGNAVAWQDEEDEEEDEDEDEQPQGNVHARNVPPVANWDDDSDDEEPAPDQRRPDRPRAHIEIVNFAANGVNRRIELQPGALPAVPDAPPAVQMNRRGNNAQAPQRQAGRPNVNVPEVRVLAAPGQGNNAGPGLQRFLRLALADREDEWDSDDDD